MRSLASGVAEDPQRGGRFAGKEAKQSGEIDAELASSPEDLRE